MRALHPLLVPLALGTACTPPTASEPQQEKSQPTAISPATAATGDKRITPRELMEFRGPIRLVNQDSGGNASVYEFSCEGFPLQVGGLQLKWELDEAGCPVGHESPLGRSTQECDAAGRVVLSTESTASGEQELYRYTYDAEGHETSRRKEKADGTLISEFIQSYNDNGDRARTEEVKAGGSTRLTTYSYAYREDGSKMQTVQRDGTLERVTWGAHGFVTRRETVGVEGNAVVEQINEYEVDERGNWTKMETRAGEDAPVVTTTREIEYCDPGSE